MPLSPRLHEALSYAATLHADQQRKASGEPYLAHLLAVAALVMEYGGNEEETIAALLHDAVEDQGGMATLAEIRRRFGPAVAEIVEGCSDTAVAPKPPWRQRKEAYIARLRTRPASVRLVSAADKLHNARSILREYRRQGDVGVAPFPRRPRRHALVLPHGCRHAETSRRQPAGGGVGTDGGGTGANGTAMRRMKDEG